MSHFPLFSELAQELQDQIWDMAIRDDEPAAQFFTIYDTHRCMPPVAPQTEGTGSPTPDPRQHPVGLTAPPRPKGESEDGIARSWADGNKSAYITDSGLWTACRGSRTRMLRRFKPVETSALMSRLGAPVGPQAAREVCRRPTASVTMPFQRDNGERQYLSIKPMEDLLYLDFAAGCGPATDADADNSFDWKFLRDIPAFRWRLPGGGWHAPLHVRHIAVEYDPDWPNGGRAMRGVDVGPRAGDVAGLEVFWFVDYTLRRRYRADFDSKRRDRLTFRVGDDHEFVEVLDTDDEWWNTSSGSSHEDRKGKSAAHDLAEGMQGRAYIDSMIAQINALDAERKAQQSNIANNYHTNLGDDGDVDRQGKSAAHDLARNMEERVCMERIIARMNAEDASREAQERNIVNNYDNIFGYEDGDRDSQSESGAHDLARDMEERVYMEDMIGQMDALDAEREAQQNNLGDEDDGPEGDDPEDDDQSISWDFAAEDDDASTVQYGPASQTPSRFGVLAYVKRGSERSLPRKHEWLTRN